MSAACLLITEPIMHFVEQHLKVKLHLKKSGCTENRRLELTTILLNVLDKPQRLVEGFPVIFWGMVPGSRKFSVVMLNGLFGGLDFLGCRDESWFRKICV